MIINIETSDGVVRGSKSNGSQSAPVCCSPMCSAWMRARRSNWITGSPSVRERRNVAQPGSLRPALRALGLQRAPERKRPARLKASRGAVCNMVAGDGIEPPTRGFSIHVERFLPRPNRSLCNRKTAVYVDVLSCCVPSGPVQS
jgi:hypothetical protein